MTRLLFAALVFVSPLAAQRRQAPTPGRRDTTQHDTTRTPSDSLSRFLENFNYRALGPAAYSGRVTAIAVPTTPEPRPKTFYIGSAGGGVWKTGNEGVTWQSVSSGLGSETVGDLAVAPSDSNIVWVGTGEKNSLRSQYWGDGVYKSTDGGRTWTKMGLADSRAIGRIVIHPTSPDTVYVAALGHLWGANNERGVYKTTDGGKTWTRILFVNDTTGFVDLEMDPRDPNTLYAAAWHRLRWGGSHMEGVGAGSGLYKTTDGGRTWTRLTDPTKKNGLPSDRLGRIGIAIAPQNPKLVFAMIQVDRGVTDPAQGRFGGVFRSSDAGATWTQVNDLQAIPHYYYDEIWVDAADSQHVFVNAAPLMESKDGGRTFAPESLSRVHGDHHALWFDPHDAGHRILGNDGGAYVTYDAGRAWWHMPIPIGQFYTVIVDSSLTPYQICGGLQDNGVWCGPSATRDAFGVSDADWYPVNGGDGMWVQMPPNDPWTVYSGSQFGVVSAFDLRSWKRDDIQPAALDAGTESGYEFTWDWTAPILVSAFDSTTVYLGANHLFRLRQHGKDYDTLGPDMTRTPRENPTPEAGHTSYHAIFSIAESPKTAAVLWTGTDDGFIWVSQDTGRTWTNVTNNFPRGAATTCWVSTIAASYHSAGTAWVTLPAARLAYDRLRPHVDGAGDRSPRGPRQRHRVRESAQPAGPLGRDIGWRVRHGGRRPALAALRQELPARHGRAHGDVVPPARARRFDPWPGSVRGGCRARRGVQRLGVGRFDPALRGRARVPVSRAAHVSRVRQPPVHRAESAAGSSDRLLPEGHAARRREARDHKCRGGHDANVDRTRIPRLAAGDVGPEPRAATASRVGRPDLRRGAAPGAAG